MLFGAQKIYKKESRQAEGIKDRCMRVLGRFLAMWERLRIVLYYVLKMVSKVLSASSKKSSLTR
jgi:hypothetical protein